MKKSINFLVIVAAAISLFGCSNGVEADADTINKAIGLDSSNSTSGKSTKKGNSSVKDSDDSDNLEVRTLKDLPKCNNIRKGDLYYVVKEDHSYKCVDGEWERQEDDVYRPVSSSSFYYSDPTIINPGYVPSYLYYSSSSSYTSSLVTPPISTYSSSSSAKTITPSYSSTSISSNSAGITKIACGDMWCGPDGDGQVKTGKDAGANLSGWWWEYNDGSSSFDWPASKGSQNSFQPIIDACGGVCGDVYLDNGTLGYNYIGIGFNVAGYIYEDDVTPETVNVSSWDGICLVYSTDGPLYVQMGLSDDREKTVESDIPRYELILGKNKVVNILWSEFSQARWNTKVPIITGTTAAKELQSIKFQFNGTEGRYSFNIMSIGTYGSCK